MESERGPCSNDPFVGASTGNFVTSERHGCLGYEGLDDRVLLLEVRRAEGLAVEGDRRTNIAEGLFVRRPLTDHDTLEADGIRHDGVRGGSPR